MARLFLLAAVLASSVSAATFFKETFGEDWSDRWTHSSFKQDSGEAGELVRTAGKWFADEALQTGVQTSEDARFYTYSAPIEEPFSVENKDLVFQFSIKHEQKIDCGGGYLKLLPAGYNKDDFNGDTDYAIMFGPDICGSGTKKVHVIINHDGENYLINKQIPCESDQLTHVYTLIIHPDETYEVRIDGEEKQTGSLKEHWDFELPKTINDPDQSKPEDWIDNPMMDDPEDEKPEDWDQPEQIPDPEAEMPEDWDEEFDGEWEAPTIPNPDYKGEWHAKQIDNPDYKGPWEHPQIPNPDWVEVEGVAKFKDLAGIGLEIWQVKAGTIFDNIIVTDSIEEAEAFLEETFAAVKDGEKEAFDKAEEERREKERIEREEAEAKRKAEEEAAAEEEDDEDDEDLEDDEEGEDDEAAEDATADDDGHEEL